MKKIISMLLSLSLLLSCLAFHATATSNDEAASEPLKVLTIGHSYTKDSMPLINKIAMSYGEEPMVLGWLYYPGCKLSMHYNYGSTNEAVYDYFKNTTGNSVETKDVTLLHGLTDEDWDIIFLQQAPCESGEPDTYDTHLDNLINFVNEHKTNTDAKFGWHMTWAYQKAYQTLDKTYSKDFVKLFNGDPLTMYNAIVSAVQTKVLSRELTVNGETVKEFVKVTPSGTAIENARTSYFGDNLQRDSYHLNQLGKVITAHAWYATLTDKTALPSINLSNELAEITLSEQDRAVILESVNNALTNRYARTQSQYTTRPDEDVYFVMSTPQSGGGTLTAYNQKDPTTPVEVTYTGRANQVSNKTFYKLENGVLTGLRIYGAQVANVGYHNYFKYYDVATQTLSLTDTPEGSCSCGFSCHSNPDGNCREVPHTIYDVPVTTPVVDVTGIDHGISTLQDVIDLSALYDIRLSHYAPNAGAPAAFYVDEVTQLEYPRPQNGDVFFALDPVKAGEPADVYFISSATHTPGSKVTVMIPNGTSGATGSASGSAGRFWEVSNGTVQRIDNATLSSSAGANRYGYHDFIYKIKYEDTPTTIILNDHTSHHAAASNTTKGCKLGFFDSCGTDDSSKNRAAYEVGPYLSFVEGTSLILDLRKEALNDPTKKITTLSGLDAATALKSESNTFGLVNTYSADATYTSKDNNSTGGYKTIAGTITAMIIVDITTTYDVTVTTPENGTLAVDMKRAAAGDTFTITATPNQGYELEAIYVDGTAIVGNTFTVTGDHTVTATFKLLVEEPGENPGETPDEDPNSHAITVADNILGGTVTVDKSTVLGSETVTVTAVPNQGYVFKAVQVNGKDISETSFVPSEDTVVTAVFAKEIKPGDVMYIPGKPEDGDFAEGYLVSSDTPYRKIWFYFKGGFSG